jgi:methylated-DNA-[protein]-cysteine S-methyltransferase
MNETKMIDTHTIDSPLGSIRLDANESALLGVYFAGQKWEPLAGHHRPNSTNPILQLAVEQLNAYFMGRMTQFDLPLETTGTEFQKQVWREIATIAMGQSLSYGQIAKRIGSPLAARAVGAATGRNPIGIIIPCHRVMGGSGALTGYAGGLEKKRWLLAHESTFSCGLISPEVNLSQGSLL